MAPDKAMYEEAAKSENEWVRAVILKPNHPAKDDALEVATNARDMAGRALGKTHPAYAEAIQNLGLYYSVIEKDDQKAEKFFEKARAVVGQFHPVLSRTFYFLGLYFEEAGDGAKAEHFFAEAMAIVKREGYAYDPRVAQMLAKLADIKLAANDRNDALKLLNQAAEIQQAVLPPNNTDRKATEKKLKLLQKAEGTLTTTQSKVKPMDGWRNSRS
jgi:tetratricopeptide (TPR) repeat protein